MKLNTQDLRNLLAICDYAMDELHTLRNTWAGSAFTERTDEIQEEREMVLSFKERVVRSLERRTV